MGGRSSRPPAGRSKSRPAVRTHQRSLKSKFLVERLAAVRGRILIQARARWSTLVGGMPYKADPRVDAYIEGLPEWQQRICQHVRDLVHDADPEVVETIKRTRQPYFVLEGNICALLATKDHVNVFLYDGGIGPDPERIITAGHDNKTARTVGLWEGDPINDAALTRMFRQIIANNRAGGWRRIKSPPKAKGR